MTSRLRTCRHVSRTFLLMSRGFVIGTGDLSEQALGWSTYNGDHMSMYNPNSSIPKTLVKFLVRYAALNEFEEGPVRDTLLSIVGTTISPELLPLGAEGQVMQSTEDILGPYELIDFILYNAVRCGYTPEKIRDLAQHATFTKSYTSEQIDRALKTFYTRFSVSSSSGPAFPTVPRWARSACRRGAIGGCRATRIRRPGSSGIETAEERPGSGHSREQTPALQYRGTAAIHSERSPEKLGNPRHSLWRSRGGSGMTSEIGAQPSWSKLLGGPRP